MEMPGAGGMAAGIMRWVPVAERRSNFENEIGLYDPHTLSLIKIRRNGGIDIFAGTNQGIRLDPNQEKISMLTNTLLANTEKLELYAHDQITAEAVKQILLRSLGDVTIEAKGKIHLKAKHIVLESETTVDVV